VDEFEIYLILKPLYFRGLNIFNQEVTFGLNIQRNMMWDNRPVPIYKDLKGNVSG
jgi:hypothetical protein